MTLRVVNDTLYYEAQIPLSLLPGIPGGGMPPDMEELHQLFSVNIIWCKYDMYRP